MRLRFPTTCIFKRAPKNNSDAGHRSTISPTWRLLRTSLSAVLHEHMKVLVYSGIWCGDCVQQCPLIHRIAEANPAKIDLRFIERPMSDELPEELRINGGSRVPVVLFFSEDWHWCATAGDRTIHRYRALALSRLGPSCPTGIIAPEKDELDATLADWLDEFERVQLMLRLAPRLRQRYQD